METYSAMFTLLNKIITMNSFSYPKDNERYLNI